MYKELSDNHLLLCCGNVLHERLTNALDKKNVEWMSYHAGKTLTLGYKSIALPVSLQITPLPADITWIIKQNL